MPGVSGGKREGGREEGEEGEGREKGGRRGRRRERKGRKEREGAIKELTRRGVCEAVELCVGREGRGV